jgi:hypothetical protein
MQDLAGEKLPLLASCPWFVVRCPSSLVPSSVVRWQWRAPRRSLCPSLFHSPTSGGQLPAGCGPAEMLTARNSCRGYSGVLPVPVTSMPQQDETEATNGTDGTLYFWGQLNHQDTKRSQGDSLNFVLNARFESVNPPGGWVPLVPSCLGGVIGPLSVAYCVPPTADCHCRLLVAYLDGAAGDGPDRPSPPSAGDTPGTGGRA